MTRGTQGGRLALFGGIGYLSFAILGRILTHSTSSGAVRVDDGGVPVRVLAAMWLLLFVVGLHDVAQRAETSGHDLRHSSSRAGSTAILLGGGLAVATLFIAPLGLYDQHTRGFASLAIAAASLPLTLVCIGAARAFQIAKAAPAPWALLGYVTAAALLVVGVLAVLRTEVRSMRELPGGVSWVDITAKPVIDPLGIFASSFFALFILWVFITGIVAWRLDRSAEYQL